MAKPIHVLVGAVKVKDWTTANEAFSGIMKQKVMTALSNQRKTIFEDASAADIGTPGKHVPTIKNEDDDSAGDVGTPGKHVPTIKNEDCDICGAPSSKGRCDGCISKNEAKNDDDDDDDEPHPKYKPENAVLYTGEPGSGSISRNPKKKDLKEERVPMTCLECGKKFKLSPNNPDPECPKCHGTDVDVD